MAVEKSIAQIISEAPIETEVEVETTSEDQLPLFESDDTVMLEDGSAIVGYVEDENELGGNFYANLAEEMDEADLQDLASELVESYKDDVESRQEWLEGYTDGLDLLGIKTDDREEPFRGASGVYHPLLAESATQFQAGAYKELLPPGGPVQTRIVGSETKEVLEQSERVRSYMNFLVLDVMEEFDPELDQMLFYLPLSGSTFKKTYYDPALKRPVSKFVNPDDLVVAYTESSLEATSRFTHVVTMNANDVRKLQVSGFYRDTLVLADEVDDTDTSEDKVQELTGFRRNIQSNDMVTLLEMHVDLDIPGYEDQDEEGEETGIAVPYIVTIHEDTMDILSIRRNYRQDDPTKTKIRYFTHYKFLPGLGFYGFGLIHMIGGLTKSATSILRQLIDAGTLANLPAGFKARGLRVRDEDLPLQPGEFRDVDAPGSSIREAIMPLPYKEPSGTLLQMLGVLIDSGRRFASVTDLNIGEGSQANPVGTTVALLEQGTKVLSAIHKRLHFAQRQELRILAEVVKNYLPAEYPYQIEGYDANVKTDDFDERIDIVPVSDPAMFSMSQRVTLAQTQLQLAQSAPQLHDLHEAYRRMYLALGIQNIDKILPPKDELVPKDPVSENMDALTGKPVKAFESQNHNAHIATHSAFLQDPNIKKNGIAQQVLMAHMQEHLALQYRQQVEQILGMPLPAEGQIMDPQQEAMLAQATAQATQQISQMAQQAAGTGQFDPIVQLKQQELQIQQQEVQRKAMADQARNQLEAAKLQQDGELKKAEISSDEDIAALRANVTLATKR
tara:strand:+ start:1529 stop:3889 length:2361 start_codon:yes stop_codon:yes gene_type:complete